MEKETGCCSTHLLEGDGTLNVDGLNNFIEQIKLKDCGVSYVVVAIMGPQSSGKSTLLNHLFHTNFKEMDDSIKRSQTTKGIWMARCVGIEPCTIVMDLEGCDGRERGEDDTAFEKQIALFGLAVSDVVLINMWCHDIGREQASNKPLLKIVFQVMVRLFDSRKTTLMFVIRDKTKTPLKGLEETLREDIEKIWDAIPKPEKHKQTRLADFFDIQVVGLTSFEERKEQFEEQVSSLRQKFSKSLRPGGLVGVRQGLLIPASGFSLSVQECWNVIKENKDLDLPAHKVMVATIRCEEIANEKYSLFVANKDWLELEGAVQSHFVEGFGHKLSLLLDVYLSSYDQEVTYFEKNTRSAKRNQLEEKLIQHVQPAYHLMLDHITSITLGNFKLALTEALNGGQGFEVAARDCTRKLMKLFDKQCQDVVIKQVIWDSTKLKDKFLRDLVSHTAEVRTTKLSALTLQFESKLKEALYGPVGALLEGGNDDSWPAIKRLFDRETEKTITEFSLSGFEMDEQAKQDKVLMLNNYAIGIVEGKAKEEAAKVLYRLKERFMFSFNNDENSMPRIWTENEDIHAITQSSNSLCLNLLSVLAAIRLDEGTDRIRDTLVFALENTDTTQQNLLASNTWEMVSATRTMITPIECKSVWNQFKEQTKFTITQAFASQEADRSKKIIIRNNEEIIRNNEEIIRNNEENNNANNVHPFVIAGIELWRGLTGHSRGADRY